jgi:hypothetical protein
MLEVSMVKIVSYVIACSQLVATERKEYHAAARTSPLIAAARDADE